MLMEMSRQGRARGTQAGPSLQAQHQQGVVLGSWQEGSVGCGA